VLRWGDAMPLKQRLQDDLKRAMREKDQVTKRTLRLALAAIKNEEIEVRGELSDADVAVVLQKQAKQRRETLEELLEVDRQDLMASEQAELEVLEAYLPKQLSRDEITDLARQVITDLDAVGPRQMGQVMGTLMPQLRGKADGKLVSQVVRELLTNRT
jgi:uncharacterized protein YqeY